MIFKLAHALIWLIGWLPLRWLHTLAVPLSWLLYWLPWNKHRVIRTNLDLCFPELNEPERRALHRRHLVELFRLILEAGAIWHWSAERIEAHVELAGWEAVAKAAAADRGVMLVSAHLGNWELLNLVLSLHLPVATLYRAPGSPKLDRFITQPRERFGGRMVAGGSPSLRHLLGQLRNGKATALAADIQPKRGDGVYVPLFDHPALTMTLVNKLAARTGCAVFLCWAERRPRGAGWTLHFEPAEASIGGPDPALALKPMNQWLERAIRSAPEQYLWLYKRFSRQPDGQKIYRKSGRGRRRKTEDGKGR
jgi:Kdo2-lipid IVA lauroyltransferase/acyltransferase